jgi:hypothetical protein
VWLKTAMLLRGFAYLVAVSLVAMAASGMPLGGGGVRPLPVVWAVPLGGPAPTPRNATASAVDTLHYYVVDGGSVLRAFRIGDGAAAWSYKVNTTAYFFGLYAGVATADNVNVVVLNYGARVEVVVAATGELLWASGAYSIEMTPLFHAGTMVFINTQVCPTCFHYLTKVDLATGRQLWARVRVWANNHTFIANHTAVVAVFRRNGAPEDVPFEVNAVRFDDGTNLWSIVARLVVGDAGKAGFVVMNQTLNGETTSTEAMLVSQSDGFVRGRVPVRSWHVSTQYYTRPCQLIITDASYASGVALCGNASHKYGEWFRPVPSKFIGEWSGTRMYDDILFEVFGGYIGASMTPPNLTAIEPRTGRTLYNIRNIAVETKGYMLNFRYFGDAQSLFVPGDAGYTVYSLPSGAMSWGSRDLPGVGGDSIQEGPASIFFRANATVYAVKKP